ncbi:hypothetical protein [Ensifer soli]|uniref:hypothetical protein n=1 Tax=Ciceribacter sp. sgz301302 TaxID=3342379 RepID=UPI0035BB8C45
MIDMTGGFGRMLRHAGIATQGMTSAAALPGFGQIGPTMVAPIRRAGRMALRVELHVLPGDAWILFHRPTCASSSNPISSFYSDHSGGNPCHCGEPILKSSIA